jgi:hypothetical protein
MRGFGPIVAQTINVMIAISPLLGDTDDFALKSSPFLLSD